MTSDSRVDLLGDGEPGPGRTPSAEDVAFDPGVFVEELGDDAYLVMLRVMDSVQGRMRDVREAVAAGDRSATRRFAAALKDISRFVGAHDLARAATHFEYSGHPVDLRALELAAALSVQAMRTWLAAFPLAVADGGGATSGRDTDGNVA